MPGSTMIKTLNYYFGWFILVSFKVLLRGGRVEVAYGECAVRLQLLTRNVVCKSIDYWVVLTLTIDVEIVQQHKECKHLESFEFILESDHPQVFQKDV